MFDTAGVPARLRGASGARWELGGKRDVASGHPAKRRILLMPLTPSWTDIAARLLLTLIAAAIIGLDREAGGHNAGLRTTILVGLAAAVAMIQANILLPIDGKTAGSFSVLDLMRLPLGILTGVGFIGGGAILRKGDLVAGVTTAGTLWIMTVIGLCFGGGQLALGVAATGLTWFTIVVLRRVDEMIPRTHHARVEFHATDPMQFDELRGILEKQGYRARFESQDFLENVIRFQATWKSSGVSGEPQRLLAILNEAKKIQRFDLIGDGEH